jgi:hypothetical protein
MQKSNNILYKLSENITNEANIFHDLMPYKVKEILLIAHIYDALSIEQEGRLSETILGDYHKLNITSIPRITSVNNYEEAMEKIEEKSFDMVIIMVGIDKKTPLRISKKIKKKQTQLPIYFLLNNPKYADYFSLSKNKKYYDKLFIWSCEPAIFFAIVKMQEDQKNLKNDIEKIGLSRILLLVEDNPQYYSRYIPTLYQSVMRQTLRITEESDIIDDSYKFLKLRLRPKILHTDNFEDAMSIYKEYKNNLLCVISDVKYKKNGSKEGEAGFELIEYIKKHTPDLPTAIESSNINNKSKAETLNSHFLYKKSKSLNHDLQHFIKYYLGFGAFLFRLPNGEQIGRAENLEDFFIKLQDLQEESLVFHASKNHFSLWLRARGEFKLADGIMDYKPDDFETPEGIRKTLIESFYKYRVEQNKGLIIETDDPAINEESNIGQLATGALGGKGRGLAFINKMIYKFNCEKLTPDIKLKTPKTFFIGTDEFDTFIENNKLYDTIYRGDLSYETTRELFLAGKLSERLISKLKKVLDLIENPIAVRSSGLFEDSLMQPFAGVFATYLLPNNHKNPEIRLKQITDAIKLVFASVFSEASKSYIKTINYNIEDEKMAVVIQEVVGNKYEDVYFPHISGTAQSFNYYPYGNIQPEDGAAVLAIGLGMYVVEGEKAMRFCPVHPKLQNHSPKDMVSNSQRELYVVDLSKEIIDFSAGESAGLKRIKVRQAEKLAPKYLKHCLSVYDGNNDVISPGTDKIGPRVVNFGNILKYNYIPLAKTIKSLLDVMKEAMGAPVEIEFSVDLKKQDGKALFYLLQVKPLIGNDTDYSIDFKKTDIENSLIISKNSMGNGLIDHIKDIIIIPPDKFNNLKTQEIAKEVSAFNSRMMEEDREYLLIGPGRWGSRDKWIGVPVLWSQISKARVIVEAGLPDFPLEASAGSHFFHNVTSMNVAYMSVKHNSKEEFIHWDKFADYEIKKETKYVQHIRLQQALKIQIDGKKRITVITE